MTVLHWVIHHLALLSSAIVQRTTWPCSIKIHMHDFACILAAFTAIRFKDIVKSVPDVGDFLCSKGQRHAHLAFLFPWHLLFLFLTVSFTCLKTDLLRYCALTSLAWHFHKPPVCLSDLVWSGFWSEILTRSADEIVGLWGSPEPSELIGQHTLHSLDKAKTNLIFPHKPFINLTRCDALAAAWENSQESHGMTKVEGLDPHIAADPDAVMRCNREQKKPKLGMPSCRASLSALGAAGTAPAPWSSLMPRVSGSFAEVVGEQSSWIWRSWWSCQSCPLTEQLLLSRSRPRTSGGLARPCRAETSTLVVAQKLQSAVRAWHCFLWCCHQFQDMFSPGTPLPALSWCWLTYKALKSPVSLLVNQPLCQFCFC